jgi:hypothetical protein
MTSHQRRSAFLCLLPFFFAAAPLALALTAQAGQEGNTVEHGSAYAVVESTYSVYPQMPAGIEGPRRVVPRPLTPPGRTPADYLPAVPGGEFETPPDRRLVTRPPEHTERLPQTPLAPSIFSFPTGQDFPGDTDTGWLPPDCIMAVGPNNIVELVNEEIVFYSKTGSQQFSQILNNSGSPGFFESVGCSGNTFDPRVVYDPASGRFIVIAAEVPSSTTAYIDIAVSDDSDPNGTWYKYRTSADTLIGGSHYWVDYPGLGVDAVGIYVTGNLFPQGSGGFGGVKYRIFDKTPMLSGGPANFADLRASGSASVQPAHVTGSAIAPYFVSVNSTSSIKLQAITNPLTAPALVEKNVTVPSFSLPTAGAPQAGTPDLIDTLDGRIINAAWRNGHLYAGHGIKASSKNVARWYEFDTNSWPTSGSPTLNQSGNIDAGTDGSGKPIHTWFPAITANSLDDVGVVLARSSVNEFAGVYSTGRLATDPTGTMAPLTTMKVGTAGYTCSRWGDYFAIGVDPADDTFWGVGEYASGSCHWRTWIGNFFLSVTRALTVNASGVTNVAVQVSPPDNNGQGDGTTPFTRTYNDGIGVTLTAPSTAGGQFFYRWTIDSVGQPSKQQTINVTMSGPHTTGAEYLTCAAFWTNYGAGWPGTNGVPGFTSNANPILGTSITLDVDNSLGAPTTGFLALGFAPASTPTIFDGTLLVVPAQFLTIPLLAGTTPLPGSIPQDASLCGISVYLQVLELDPGASKGIAFSQGLQLALGV